MKFCGFYGGYFISIVSVLATLLASGLAEDGTTRSNSRNEPSSGLDYSHDITLRFNKAGKGVATRITKVSKKP